MSDSNARTHEYNVWDELALQSYKTWKYEYM